MDWPWARIREPAARGWRLTAWDMARRYCTIIFDVNELDSDTIGLLRKVIDVLKEFSCRATVLCNLVGALKLHIAFVLQIRKLTVK
jgi:hypothetical protein